ncbi:MAG: 3-methyl-2-oxobutanoate hydroxymethyltransferase [Leptospiraceae bacterium]|nr:3-methyl-2-oxobutanoate hydroxymethyltransferase [Leptospiraceae bacterium]MCP5493067.1 3-methyl-2-oxobutanoate hydroxymethyltransferase [Leptospiraceae bacterium]
MNIINFYKEKKKKKEPISMITCYDSSFARIIAGTDIDSILVGDSLGMVFQGNSSTIPVTLDEMIYHTKAVKRGAPNKLIICDLPFLSYHISIERGIESAGKALKETNCDAVKIESNSEFILELTLRLVEIGIPVMGHLGLTPQSHNTLGGHKIQGREADAAQKIAKGAVDMEESGAFAIVLEMIPEKLGLEITNSIEIPTIGIGAGRGTDGQVLVINDLLGVDSSFHPKFLKKYANLHSVVGEAIRNYDTEVKSRVFPSQDNIFH